MASRPPSARDNENALRFISVRFLQGALAASLDFAILVYRTAVTTGSAASTAAAPQLNAPAFVAASADIIGRVTLHACTVEDACLIGMGAVVLDGAVVGHGSIVGAHALVTKGTIIPPHSLVLGSPAKVVKQLPLETEQANINHAKDYIRLALEYAAR